MRQLLDLHRPVEHKVQAIDLNALLDDILALMEDGFARMNIKIERDYDAQLVKPVASPDLLRQVFINLVRNAVDASTETGGGVRIAWRRRSGFVEVVIDDEGPGLSNTSNLFVPFFTTKPGGSGIGLVLSRQIAEAHGGSLTLENRKTGHGCEARLRLPLEANQ